MYSCTEAGPEGQKAFADHPSHAAAMRLILVDPISEPEDIANAVLFLGSDESRTITGSPPGTTVRVCYIPGWRSRVPAAQA